MSDHEQHAGAVDDSVTESAPYTIATTCGGLSPTTFDVMESVAGALGWLFAQEEGGEAPPPIDPAAEERAGEMENVAVAEGPPIQAKNDMDENTIPPPPPPPANAEADEQADDAEACAPTKAAAALTTSEDTVVTNSSASSDISNKKENRPSRAKLVGIVAVGLVLIVAIVVGALIGASGTSSRNASVQQLQGADTQNAEKVDSYPSENDGAGEEAAKPSPPGQQSPLPADRPSLRPTPSSADDMISVEAAPVPIDNLPAEASDDIHVQTSFSFYVTGDVPYNPNQKVIVQDQIIHLAEDVIDEDLFLIHVGDAMNAKQGCKEKDFVFMRDLLTLGLPELPSFIIPGDNDWNDCPSRSAAWKLWVKHFMAFENNWNGTERFAPFQGSTVQRQSIREENFSFVAHGVLFFSLHWLGGGKDSRTAARMIDNDAWIEEQVQKHGDSIESGRIRAIVIFSHALTKSDLSQNSLHLIRNSFEQYDVPVVLFKGDKHTFEVCDSFLGIGWDNFKIVQVDQGGNAPPVRVSVLGEGIKSGSPSDSNATIPLADFIHLDRRGGLYSWAPTDQLPNACGAVSRGEVY